MRAGTRMVMASRTMTIGTIRTAIRNRILPTGIRTPGRTLRTFTGPGAARAGCGSEFDCGRYSAKKVWTPRGQVVDVGTVGVRGLDVELLSAIGSVANNAGTESELETSKETGNFGIVSSAGVILATTIFCAGKECATVIVISSAASTGGTGDELDSA